MDLAFKKKIDNLQKEVSLKSVDLNEDSHDFHVEITEYSADYIIISIAPNCVRCNICYYECPVDAIGSSSAIKRAKIHDNCVDCEICAQSCPISCIGVINAKVYIDDDVHYELERIDVPHRIVRLESIEVDNTKCAACGTCVKFCPTSAIKLRETTSEDDMDIDSVNKFGEREFAHVNRETCIGCGACANVCNENAITVSRELGPIIKTKKLLIDQDTCVECLVCEETCPVEAIRLVDGKIVLDEDKCILCDVCSTNCPVCALELKRLENES